MKLKIIQVVMEGLFLTIGILKKEYSKNGNEILLIEQSKSILPSSRNKVILIIGVIHGDEPQGQFLIENYIKKIDMQTDRRVSENQVSNRNKMIFIPCLNPDGMASNTRQNASGVDINRNFPTKNWEISNNTHYFGGDAPSSEIETRFVIDVMNEYKLDIILLLHAPYKVVNYDGPAKNIAQKIAEIIKYPTSNDIGYPTSGSFGTYAGKEQNIPTITLELDEEIDVKELIKPINKIFEYLSKI